MTREDALTKWLPIVLTNDKKGCTVSIEVESIGLMFTVPFDEPLKDLEEAEHERNGRF